MSSRVTNVFPNKLKPWFTLPFENYHSTDIVFLDNILLSHYTSFDK